MVPTERDIKSFEQNVCKNKTYNKSEGIFGIDGFELSTSPSLLYRWCLRREISNHLNKMFAKIRHITNRKEFLGANHEIKFRETFAIPSTAKFADQISLKETNRKNECQATLE